MSEYTEEIRDELGNLIVVGSRCVYGLPEPDEISDSLCTVVEITESDADYDDELGRAVMYGPYVKIRFDSGEEERLTAILDYAQSSWEYPVFTVADIELYKPFVVGRTETTEVYGRFAMLAEAEAWIAEREKIDPDGVIAGDYYLDAPEYGPDPTHGEDFVCHPPV